MRKTVPAIFTLEGLLYIPHLNICELNSLKKSIESHTIDFLIKNTTILYDGYNLNNSGKNIFIWVVIAVVLVLVFNYLIKIKDNQER